MPSREIRIRSSEGGELDCHLHTPDAGPAVPAIVLASAICGVDDDIRAIAGDFASHGYIVAAPDLFWRTLPGPLAPDDPRAAQRAQPRLDVIKTGERDLVDVLSRLREEPLFNGRAALMGFCYGGPYAILGPKRLGYDAGIACHGTRMLDFIAELEGLNRPICVLSGDDDRESPPAVLDAYRAVAARRKNVEVHVFPGVRHGYTMRSRPAFDRGAYKASTERAQGLMQTLGNAATRRGSTGFSPRE
jgi:carboxymethylenebutenolidase